MSKRISAAIAGLLMVFSSSPEVRAQGTGRLQVRVTVVPAVSAGVVQDPRTTADVSQDTQFSWSGKQQSHIITRTANPVELGNTWLNSQNACPSVGTKVLHEAPRAESCEITINTVEFIPE
jgi:hypothetical protein